MGSNRGITRLPRTVCTGQDRPRTDKERTYYGTVGGRGWGLKKVKRPPRNWEDDGRVQRTKREKELTRGGDRSHRLWKRKKIRVPLKDHSIWFCLGTYTRTSRVTFWVGEGRRWRTIVKRRDLLPLKVIPSIGPEWNTSQGPCIVHELRIIHLPTRLLTPPNGSR